MWRSFFLAIGISLGILGAECLVIDKAFITVPSESGPSVSLYESKPTREMVPPEWAPWSLLSAGAVISLYALTVARSG